MHTARSLLLTVLALPLLTGQGRGPSGPPKLQVLIITGQNGHDWKGTTPVLRKELEDTGRFEVRVTEEFRGAGPETLAPYDVVVVNYFERGQAQLRWGDRADNALADFIRSGKGLVIYHFSLAAFTGWTEYEKMSAGNWRAGNGHHSARHDFTVDIKDANHPILAGLKTPLPVQNEELYANLKWQPEGTYHVLATAYDDHSRYDEHASDARNKQPMSGAGVNEPILWTTEYGQGRVFVTALGHDADTSAETTFKVTFTRGTEWAATGKVTLPAPGELAK
ncbi:MAG TPA: ThuA domain-containing protein [Bryobacteraceae bacterium]|nr:ThuA domain-containing protein [Bryobacteraceae bacterium]